MPPTVVSRPPSVALALAWSVGLLVLLTVPGAYVPETSFFSPDKIVHVVLFGVLGVLWLWAYPARRAAVVGGGLAFAVSTEIWQHVLPINRSGDVADVLADAVGLALAVVVVGWLDRSRRSRGAGAHGRNPPVVEP